MNPFKKTHEFLICADSDGCAIDSMTVKHETCFGPELMKEWNLPLSDANLKLWNDINLYTQTRGINRFLGLTMFLEQIELQGHRIEGLDSLKHWTKTSSALSNQALKEQILSSGNPVFQKALNWSLAVNKSIEALPSLPMPFPGVKEGLARLSELADLAIVSSANSEALEKEWSHAGLLPYIGILMSQNHGSKAACLKELAALGYGSRNILMVGDSPGDLSAAREAQVLFYPILVGQEELCWKRLTEEAAPKLLDGTYEGAYQDQQILTFETNLRQ